MTIHNINSNTPSSQTFEIRTGISNNDLIEQELVVKHDNKIEILSRWVIHLREKSTQEALIKLGWTPPLKQKEPDYGNK